jgi:hypothetical protein
MRLSWEGNGGLANSLDLGRSLDNFQPFLTGLDRAGNREHRVVGRPVSTADVRVNTHFQKALPLEALVMKELIQ